jgi:hypothetical protein
MKEEFLMLALAAGTSLLEVQVKRVVLIVREAFQ